VPTQVPARALQALSVLRAQVIGGPVHQQVVRQHVQVKGIVLLAPLRKAPASMRK
jgi:hypothetical protein